MDLKYETIIVDPESDRRPPVGAAVGLGPPGPDRPPGMWSSPLVIGFVAAWQVHPQNVRFQNVRF